MSRAWRDKDRQPHSSTERAEISSGNYVHLIAWENMSEVSDAIFRSFLNERYQRNLTNFLKCPTGECLVLFPESSKCVPVQWGRSLIYDHLVETYVSQFSLILA